MSLDGALIRGIAFICAFSAKEGGTQSRNAQPSPKPAARIVPYPARAAAPGKRILISETGWPDQGSAFHGAVPGTEAAMQYFVDTAAWAEAEGIEWFHFAAFDEAWKVGAEGDVGAFWGLWDKDARPKFA